MSEGFNVLVIDDTGQRRRMARALSRAGYKAYTHQAAKDKSTRSLYQVQEGTRYRPPSYFLGVKPVAWSFDLVLLHQSCNWAWECLKEAGVSARLLIWYTVNGTPMGLTPPSGADAGILQRSLGHNSLSDDEAGSIASWASAKLRGRNPPKPPILLQPPPVTKKALLDALSLLCEAYLVVGALHGKVAASGESPAARALRHMGWGEAEASIREAVSDTCPPERWDEVQAREWWLEAFLGAGSRQKRAEAGGLQGLKDALTAEVRQRSATGEGLSCLKEWLLEASGDIDSELAATAYCNLARALGGAPCP